MKRTIQQLTGMVVLTTALILSGCNKQPVDPNVKPHTTDNSKRIHCSPWEDVAASDALNDLNQVAACNSSTCEGTPYYYHINGISVSGFYDPFLVTVADQNYIWSSAVSYGTSHGPSGYSLSQITFHTSTTTIPGTNILANVFTFDVVYVQCTGGGGGGND